MQDDPLESLHQGPVSRAYLRFLIGALIAVAAAFAMYVVADQAGWSPA